MKTFEELKTMFNIVNLEHKINLPNVYFEIHVSHTEQFHYRYRIMEYIYNNWQGDAIANIQLTFYGLKVNFE